MIVSVLDHFASNADADDEDQDGLSKEFRQRNIANDSKFQHIPDTTKERDILYITGPSGSGKSTYTPKYLDPYITSSRAVTFIYFQSPIGREHRQYQADEDQARRLAAHGSNKGQRVQGVGVHLRRHRRHIRQ